MSEIATSTEERGHAKLSPSSSDRWLECPASIARTPADLDDEGSDAAHEGSGAHDLAEYCLKNKCDAAAGKMAEQYAKWDTPELRDFVQIYLDYVRRLVADGDLFVEQTLFIFKRYGVWGTADAVIVTRDGTIHVIDLKFGSGILVEADNNTQLMLYGIGGLAFDWLSPVPVHTVHVHIVQPRRGNYPSQAYPVEQLAQWVKDNEHKVARAFSAVNEASPGTHCRWCPVKGTCKERAEANLALASFDFAPAKPACTGDSSGMSEDELVKVFTALPQIRQYLDDVEAEVSKRAHDHEVKGVKWIAGRVTRKIVDVVKAAAAFHYVGIHPFANAPLLGIGDLEKLCKEKKLKLETVLGDAMAKVSAKPVLVAESHPSPALNPASAAVADFTGDK